MKMEKATKQKRRREAQQHIQLEKEEISSGHLIFQHTQLHKSGSGDDL